MMNKKYKREYKESQPVLAICYDFDIGNACVQRLHGRAGFYRTYEVYG